MFPMTMNLSHLEFPHFRVQEIFKDSLQSPELRLRVVKHHSSLEPLKKPPAPVFPRSLTQKLQDKEVPTMVEGEERCKLLKCFKLPQDSRTKRCDGEPHS